MTPILGIMDSAKLKGTGGWLSVYTSALGTPNYYGATIDSSNNFYVASAAGSSSELVKLTNTGTISSIKTLSGCYPTDIAYDSSGNIYMVANTTGTINPVLAKYNSSGTLQWQRKLSTTYEGDWNSVFVSSSNNIYAAGFTYPNAPGAGVYADMLIAKYDSTGSLLWQRKVSDNFTDYAYIAVVDSSENSYLIGSSVNSSSNNVAAIIKYNSTGTLQWQETIIGTPGAEVFYEGAIDSSGNVYGVGTTLSTYYNAWLLKANSSGVIQWQKQLSTTANGNFLTSCIDSSGNIYCAGNTGSSGTSLLAKYNSSGTIQWQRTITNFGGINKMQLDSTGTYLYGISNYSKMFKIKTDGSGTGTYVLSGTTHVYAASSLTDGTASTTASTSLFNSVNMGYTDTVAGLTDGTTSVSSSSLVNI